MSRRREAPDNLDCPYRHQCPHLDGMACSWAMENYQEAFELREQLHALEQRYEQRIAELVTTLAERDQKIAQLRLQHQKQFKANRKPVAVSPEAKPRKRGAPVGHPPWRRRELTHVDQVIQVPAPEECPHCQGHDLEPHPEVYEHVQEDIILQPRVHVTKRVHGQCYCRTCRRVVYQVAPGEIPGVQIGPVTRAVSTHLRYDLQIPYRKVQHILQNLFGMPLVPASAMTFDRKATVRARPLYEELRVKLQSSPVVYADETSWREDGHGRYVWFGGHENLVFFQITDNRSSDSALQLLGNDFAGTLITDAYAAYNAVNASARQTCWSHIGTHCKELLQQIELTQPPVAVPQSVRFLKQIRQLKSDLCGLGRQLRNRQLKRSAARAMIPSLQKRLERIAGKPMDYAPAETLRQRLMNKDYDKLFAFLRIKGVEPTNNYAERMLRFLVIMRKICNGTRSAGGSESHAVLPSMLQTARCQGKSSIEFLTALITQPIEVARAALFAHAA
jgi:transposase